LKIAHENRYASLLLHYLEVMLHVVNIGLINIMNGKG